ncbi:MAG: S1/P1 nuclease [Gammaproteobacteria bacterium]
MKIFNRRYLLTILLFILLPIPALAWNASGHMLVGQIAYQHLKPSVKEQVDTINQALNNETDHMNFVQATTWADVLKGQGVRIFDTWHYINRPYAVDNKKGFKPQRQNLVWAVNESIKVLKNPKSGPLMQSFFLRFLIHLVADAHQPQHTISFFSQDFPRGDLGGLLYKIKAPGANNLHEFWDRGAGLFYDYGGRQRLNFVQVVKLSQALQGDYPAEQLSTKIKNLDAQIWVNESYKLAINFNYQTAKGSKPDADYIKQGQVIVGQQIVLAGHRLAALLNNLYG